VSCIHSWRFFKMEHCGVGAPFIHGGLSLGPLSVRFRVNRLFGNFMICT